MSRHREEPSVISTCRLIVSKYGCKIIDGFLVDIVTARMLVRVYESLNQESRTSLCDMPFGRMVKTAWCFA